MQASDTFDNLRVSVVFIHLQVNGVRVLLTAYQYQSLRLKGLNNLDSAVVNRFCNHGEILRNLEEQDNLLLSIYRFY
jgi:hypothetical protein